MQLDVASLEKLMKKAAPLWQDMDNPPTENNARQFRQYAALIILKQVKEALEQHQNSDGSTIAKVALGFELEIPASTTASAEGATTAVTLRCTRWGWPGGFDTTWDV
ncbi:MAG: hypothetical protein AAFQ15_11390 [Pseudomonadota bacterium]